MNMPFPLAAKPFSDTAHLEDLKQAAAKMLGAERRSFQAAMALKYCGGSARLAETVFGWNRDAVELGLHERRSGVVCLGAQKACSGNKLWEDKHPEAAAALWSLAESHAPGSDFPHHARLHPADGGGGAGAVAWPWLRGGRAALAQHDGGGAEPQRLPAAPGGQGQASKKVPQTDAIFANLREKDGQSADGGKVKRLSIDCKATVNLGEYSRGGKTRGDNQAADHDMGCAEKHTPFGLVDEDSGRLHLIFGSSAKTSDFIVDGLEAWWERLPPDERDGFSVLQIKADNGPESNGRRTQFLKRMVDFAGLIGKPVQLLYYPPYHSKYNPVESAAGAFWKGTGTGPSWWTWMPCSDGPGA